MASLTNSRTLNATVRALLSPGKGLLAADESFPTIEKRFKEICIVSSEETRRDYRELLFTAPDLGRYISGAILFDETIRQETPGGVPMVKVLEKQGIVPGIKVDGGTILLANSKRERMTAGLDGLRERLASYRALGARFTKWRAVFAVGPRLPSEQAVATNSRTLALFAALSQEAGLVPIVEPEVLMEGNHSIGRCEEVTARVLGSVFGALSEQGVILEGMLLKTGMLLPGSEADEQASPARIAEASVRCFRRTVPAAVPGIVFLSGGQSARDASIRLAALCRTPDLPWKLSFSFGRALQAPALKSWRGSRTRVPAAQKALLACAKRNGAATSAGSGFGARMQTKAPRPC